MTLDAYLHSLAIVTFGLGIAVGCCLSFAWALFRGPNWVRVLAVVLLVNVVTFLEMGYQQGRQEMKPPAKTKIRLTV